MASNHPVINFMLHKVCEFKAHQNLPSHLHQKQTKKFPKTIIINHF